MPRTGKLLEGKATSTSLDALFSPKSIALIGASASSRVGTAIVNNLKLFGYEGQIFPVNPRYTQLAGLECYPSVSAIPHGVDAAMIGLGASQAVAAIRECASEGIRGIVVTAEGFSERDAAGRQLQSELTDLATANDLALCGPNCMGIINSVTGASLYTGVLQHRSLEGSVSAVLQSGSLSIALSNNMRGLGFRYLISSGNEAVLSAADYVQYLTNDPGTKVICLAVEAIRHSDRLLAAALMAAEKGIPIVMLRLGTSQPGGRSAAAHTGALAGTLDVTAGICKQYGIVLVSDVEELINTCLLFSGSRVPKGRRVGVITISGGYATLAADLGDRVGLEFPDWGSTFAEQLSDSMPEAATIANPIDVWNSGKYSSTLTTALRAAQDDDAIDFVLIPQDLPPRDAINSPDVPRTVADLVAAADSSKKSVVMMGSVADSADRRLVDALAGAGVAYLQGAEAGIRALSHWSRYSERMTVITKRSVELGPVSPSLQSQDVLDAIRGKGVRFAKQVIADSLTQGKSAAEELGFPVVLKVLSPDLPHKTEAGAVRLNVERTTFASEWHDLLRTVRSRAPAARISGITVEEQAKPGFEVIVGATVDPEWGWVVMFGAGGIFVEAFDEVAFRRVPLTRRDAWELLADTRVHRLLVAQRGQPARDQAALVELVLALSDELHSQPRSLSAIEFNPVIVYSDGDGIAVVDSLIDRNDGG